MPLSRAALCLLAFADRLPTVCQRGARIVQAIFFPQSEPPLSASPGLSTADNFGVVFLRPVEAASHKQHTLRDTDRRAVRPAGQLRSCPIPINSDGFVNSG